MEMVYGALTLTIQQPITDFGALLLLLVPAVSGFLSTLIIDGLKGTFAKIAALPDGVKAMLFPVISFLIGTAAVWLGVAPDALPALDGPVDTMLVNGILTAFIAAGIHRWQKKPAA